MSAPSVSWWLDDPTPFGSVLTGEVSADVVVVGAGFTGLWTALQLTDRDPSLRVTVLEAATVGYGASGRNGGFVDPSLTHGIENGRTHFPGEADDLVRLGRENLTGLLDFVRDHDVDCDLELVGTLEVATEPWQRDALEHAATSCELAGEPVQLLDAEQARKEVDSPTYLAALRRPTAGALVDPGGLVRGLARVARDRGVVIHEGSPATAITPTADGATVRTTHGAVRAGAVVVATNAYTRRLLPRTGRWFVPVHDYVLLTRPLTPEQLARIGWQGRQGLSDAANQFHYYRLTRDDRILWGGYDAVYAYGSGVGPRHDHRRATYDVLARNFRATFPQLHDVRFDRWWGGPIATTTRFTMTFGDELDGRVVWALGYTGLGVGASRFAARVLTDRLLDPSSPLLELDLVRRPPFPFPPEPLRWAGITLTRRAIARADGRAGRRGPWLGLLDRFGIGFDS